MNDVKCIIVETNKKIEGEWYKRSKTFNTIEEVFDYVNDNKVNRFTITVVRKKDAEEQGVLL